MSKTDKALSLFQDGYSCSQAVFGAYCEDFGVDFKIGCKIASGIGGGMFLGSVCGAVTGAIMVLGLKFGEGKNKCYDKSQEFGEKFIRRNGSYECPELLGFDVRTDEGMRKLKSDGKSRQICEKAVKDACDILYEIGV